MKFPAHTAADIPAPSTVTLTLDRNDAGQILDGIIARQESWQVTADYLNSGSTPDDTWIVEECESAEEAQRMADTYQRLVDSRSAQLQAQ